MERDEALSLSNLHGIREALELIATSLERLSTPLVELREVVVQRCDGCGAWDGSHCRAHAPIVVQRGDKVWSGWPLAQADEWCGEWRKA
jgi:hypothetical protein